MTLYADSVWAVNTIINFLILQLGSRISGFRAKPLRCLAGAALGGIYAVFSALPAFSVLTSFFGQTLSYLIMCAVAFGVHIRYLRAAALSFLCTMALAGFIQLFMRLFRLDDLYLSGGILYPSGTKILILMAGFFYLTAGILTAKSLRHGAGEVRNIKIICNNRQIVLSALCDTGNTLHEPISGRPVAVVEARRSAEIFGCSLDHKWLDDPTSCYSCLVEKFPEHRFSLIPYRSVGVPAGMLLSVACQIVIGRRKENIYAAFSPSPVSDSGSYEALIGGALI